MDKKTKKGWEYPACNLCGKVTFKPVWEETSSWMTKGTFRIIRCSNCSLVYLSPRPNQKTIGKYYAPESYWGTNVKKYNRTFDFEKRDKAYDFLYKEIFKLENKGSILDIGAGTGLFLTKFKEIGWEIDGVELSPDACKFAKKAYGLDLIEGDFLRIDSVSKKYDVVTLNGCLEHLHRPKETLKKVKRVLKKNGRVIITVPNFDSLGRKLFGKEWYALQPPTHLYHFTPKTLSSMLKTSGFRQLVIKHSYREHNYYIIFESLRMRYSPKVNKKTRGSIKGDIIKKKSDPSLLLDLGKISARVLATTVSFIEPYLKRGEVISVYAK